MQIHWHEGLFLQPHHLQRLQKSFHDQVSAERQLTGAYPYGLLEARLSRDELENMRIRFERLRAIMPSGQIVNVPENSELPSLDIKQALSKSVAGFKIFLGVPLWQNVRANTVDTGPSGDTRAKLIYRVSEIECADENTGENPKPVQVRKVADNRVQLVLGYRRHRAALLYNLRHPDNPMKLKCVVVTVNDEEAFRRNIVENKQRAETTPIDDAFNQRRLREEFGWTDARIAEF